VLEWFIHHSVFNFTFLLIWKTFIDLTWNKYTKRKGLEKELKQYIWNDKSGISVTFIGTWFNETNMSLISAFIASSTSWPEGPARKASFTVTRVPVKMVLKTFVRRTELDTSQHFEFKDNDKNWEILTKNGYVDWSPAHVYGNHNWTGNQNNVSGV
jgi:hypothetical protein